MVASKRANSMCKNVYVSRPRDNRAVGHEADDG